MKRIDKPNPMVLIIFRHLYYTLSVREKTVHPKSCHEICDVTNDGEDTKLAEPASLESIMPCAKFRVAISTRSGVRRGRLKIALGHIQIGRLHHTKTVIFPKVFVSPKIFFAQF